MNSKFHKAQAEALIKEFNGINSYDMKDLMAYLLVLAQVHATLATVPDEETND